MKHFYLIILLMVSITNFAGAQIPTTAPTSCGKTGSPSISTIGTTSSFTFKTLTDFTGTNSSSPITFTIAVNSPSSPFTLYAAGVITYSGSPPSISIPITTFNLSANGGTAFPLIGNQWVDIADNVSKKITSEIISVTLNPVGNMDLFQQPPGIYTLTLSFYLCN